MTAMNEEERPVAWTAIYEDEEVLSADDSPLGQVQEVLGTGPTGIFHGLVVRTPLVDYPVEVPAANVAGITNRRVTLSIGQEDFRGLPAYREVDSFSLGIKGLLRRVGWKEDR